MNDEERLAAYDALRELAVRRGLDWAVDEAELQISEGKLIELREPVIVRLPGRRASRVQKGSAAEPYTPLERLEILAEAIRRAVVLPVWFERDVREFFAGSETNTESNAATDETNVDVAFLGSPEDEPTVAVGSGALDDRIEGAQVLSSALTALLTEARS